MANNLNVHCLAPWVAASIYPGNQFAPCCIWQDKFESNYANLENIRQQIVQGIIPLGCDDCTYRFEFDKYDSFKKLQFLEIKNDITCNLKCRSCSELYSSSIAVEELGTSFVNLYNPFDLEQLDLTNISKIYFTGGEPFLNPQQVEILLNIKDTKSVELTYNTNLHFLNYKKYYLPDIWANFKKVRVNASIDAVEKMAAHIRSNSNWNKVETNLNKLKQLSNVEIFVTPVISALNIWWFDCWSKYFDWLDVSHMEPIVPVDIYTGVQIIPRDYRADLIEIIKSSPFASKLTTVLDMLNNQFEEIHWDNFIFRQQQLDQKRNEQWIKNFLDVATKFKNSV
jgi:sulfatase maturation enzyme AslB (radical SAM superfamily)